MPAKKKLSLMREPNSPRGLVPTASDGRYDEPYNAYLDALAPKENREFQLALASSNDQRFREFLSRLSEPRYRTWKLATIAKTCDISLPQFADFWQSAQKLRILARAQDGLLEVTDDIVLDARSKFVNCERCDGFGFVYMETLPDGPHLNRVKGVDVLGDRQIRACPDCLGLCKIRKPGDSDSRRSLLEMTGLSGKKSGAGGAKVTLNFGTMESAVDKLSRVSFEVGDADDAIDVDG